MTDTSNAAANAPVLPLFYTNPIPVMADRHKDWKVKQARGYGYAARTHAVPVVLDEVPSLQGYYPLVFSAGDKPGLVALLGLRPDENLFTKDDGAWAAGQPIPSYIRRYPFILLEVPEEKRMILAVEEDASLVGPGYDLGLYEDGKPAKFGEDVMNYCMAFNQSAIQTQAFCDELQARGLLVDQRADIVTAANKKLSLTGFRVVDEQKLNALPDEVFLEWRKRGWIGMIYAHMMSLGRWQHLIDLLNARDLATAA